MIRKSIDEHGVATVRMSVEEADVLERALTIAKLHAGEQVVLGQAGRSMGIQVEHLRGVLKDITRGR